VKRKNKIESYIKIIMASESTYVVVPGDTFGQIAERMGVSQEELRLANPGVTPGRIWAGQLIVVPEPSNSIDLIISVVMAEAQAQGVVAMKNVFTVIKNRSEYSGKSMYEVVTSPYEFSCLNSYSASTYSEFIMRYKNTEKWAAARQIVSSGEKSGGEIGNASYYYSIRLSSPPYWARQENNCWVELGRDSGHVFGKGGRPWDSCLPS